MEEETEREGKMALNLSVEQFEAILSRIPTSTTPKKSFTRCTLIYDGERDYCKVDEFLNGITIYKEIELITDEDALSALPLLLKETASVWWLGVKSEIKTWNAALKAIRASFAPKLQPYEIYLHLFSDIQASNEFIDNFICRKRALLGMLPLKRHKEDEQIDMIYGLLDIEVKKKIARTDVTSFTQLLEKARHLESLNKPSSSQASKMTPPSDKPKLERKPSVRCLYCNKRGHVISECRKRNAETAAYKQQKADATTSDPLNDKPLIKCYGCGAPGVFRSNCTSCKTKDSPTKPIRLYHCEARMEEMIRLPTVEVKYNGILGHAFIDTCARTSIAGRKLYQIMTENGAQFKNVVTTVGLADGSNKTVTLFNTDVEISLGNKLLPISFSVFPDAEDSRTLLGIDFLEKSGMVLNLPQRAWHFIDSPEQEHLFVQEKTERPQLLPKKLQFENTEEHKYKKFLAWAADLKMLSPMHPSPDHSDDELPNSAVVHLKLEKLDLPPRPARPRKPYPIGSDVALDPRVDYVPYWYNSTQCRPFIIKTDASNYAIGAALIQGESEDEHPIEYASRLLTPAETNYSVTEKDALAIVWAVSRFRGYIEGTKFLTITDHQPLKWLLNLKTPTGRLARLAMQLQPYELEIKYTPRKTNTLADTLSRPQCEDQSDELMMCHIEFDLPTRGEKNIRDEQLKDEELGKIINSLEDNNETEDFIQWSKRGYILHKGVLYRTRRPDPGYNKGDLVLVETHPISRQDKDFSAKLAPRRDGPYVIIRKIGSTMYEVANIAEPEKPIGKYHTAAITKYEPRQDQAPDPILPIRKRGRPRKAN